MGNPMYRQIAENLREQIESGLLRPGQQLPTELELREEHGASRNTVRDAIKWLINLDLVETRPGQGTFVVQKIAPYITMLSGEPGAGEGAAYSFQVSKHGRTPNATGYGRRQVLGRSERRGHFTSGLKTPGQLGPPWIAEQSAVAVKPSALLRAIGKFVKPPPARLASTERRAVQAQRADTDPGSGRRTS